MSTTAVGSMAIRQRPLYSILWIGISLWQIHSDMPIFNLKNAHLFLLDLTEQYDVNYKMVPE